MPYTFKYNLLTVTPISHSTHLRRLFLASIGNQSQWKLDNPWVSLLVLSTRLMPSSSTCSPTSRRSSSILHSLSSHLVSSHLLPGGPPLPSTSSQPSQRPRSSTLLSGFQPRA